MSTGKTVTWMRPLYNDLVAAHRDAAAAQKSSFDFDLGKGNMIEMDVRYAGYLIEFLAPDFAAPDQPRRPYNEGEEGQ